MSYFTTRKQFLTPSFDLSEEDEQILTNFFIFLEKSDVGKIIQSCTKNETANGGRPNVNYYNLFAAVVFGFAFGRDTLRDLEDACGHDIRFISIMEQIRPKYNTICNYINKVIVPNEKQIFKLLVAQIIKELDLKLEDAFVDGSKFEANANKYKFVWKPTTFHMRISKTFFSILKENNLCVSYRNEELVKSKTVGDALKELESVKDRYDKKIYKNLHKALYSILIKVIDYEEKEKICGPNRNSYYKTDHDATAMALKADYYSGLGTNMHAAYNTQIIVVKGIICGYYTSQSRSDYYDFIAIIETFYYNFDAYPSNICADAGYGSLQNYLYLEKHNIGNYVKYQTWEGNSSGSYPECYKLNNDNETITCLNGLIGRIVEIENRHPKKANAKFFKVVGCENCLYKSYCWRFTKNQNGNEKIFEVVIDLLRLKQQAENNLLSPKGIEMRINRSIQVEGAFGNEKQNRGYTRSRRRGIEKVSTEMMLIVLGLNIKKLFNYYKTKKLPDYWIAPEGLEAQQFKKPSAKRLSKKGRRINMRTYKIEQA